MNALRLVTVGIALGLGVAVPAKAAGPFSFSNHLPISINDGLPLPAKASPYPSAITVSGLEGFLVSKVTVRLWGFSHDFPSDVEMLLVGPGGQRSVVMAACGGQNKYSVTNLLLVFQDSASSNAPVRSALTSANYRPTNGYLSLGYTSLPWDFPLVVPPGSSNAPASFSVFQNAAPNGTWSLYVLDDGFGNTGVISGGWDLELLAGVPMEAQRQGDKLVVSWPQVVYTLTLQVSANVDSGWSNSGIVPTLYGGKCWVTNSIGSEPKFFRLTGP